jgi:hypothetical protein
VCVDALSCVSAYLVQTRMCPFTYASLSHARDTQQVHSRARFTRDLCAYMSSLLSSRQENNWRDEKTPCKKARHEALHPSHRLTTSMASLCSKQISRSACLSYHKSPGSGNMASSRAGKAATPRPSKPEASSSTRAPPKCGCVIQTHFYAGALPCADCVFKCDYAQVCE